MVTTENITIYQGADFNRNISLVSNGQPLDVTGYTANGAMKIDPYSTTANVYVFETNLTNGNLNIVMWANATINIPPGYYQYDVLIWNGTTTNRLVEGIAQVDPNIANT